MFKRFKVCFIRLYQSNYNNETYGKLNAVSGIHTYSEVGPVAHGDYNCVLSEESLHILYEAFISPPFYSRPRAAIFSGRRMRGSESVPGSSGFPVTPESERQRLIHYCAQIPTWKLRRMRAFLINWSKHLVASDQSSMT